MNVDIDYDDELEKNTDPHLLPNPDKEKVFTYTYQFLIQIRQLNDPRRPIAAGVCCDPPYLTL